MSICELLYLTLTLSSEARCLHYPWLYYTRWLIRGCAILVSTMALLLSGLITFKTFGIILTYGMLLFVSYGFRLFSGNYEWGSVPYTRNGTWPYYYPESINSQHVIKMGILALYMLLIVGYHENCFL